MRRFLLIAFGLLFAASASLLVALRSESFALDLARWAVATFTSLHLEMRNPHLDVYGRSFSADELHLLPDDSDGPALLSVLELDVSWPRKVHAGAVMIYVSDNGKAENPEPTQWLEQLRWLPAELRIGQVHLISDSRNIWIFPLKDVRGELISTGNYLLSAEADYSGEPLGAAVELLAVEKGLGVTAAETRVTLTAPQSGSVFLLAGNIEGTSGTFLYDFSVDAYYHDIADFLRGFEGGKQLSGKLELHGKMDGDSKGFRLSDTTFVLDNTPEYDFTASGTLDYQFTGESRVDLSAKGELASLTYLVDWLDVDVSEFGKARSSIRLSGSLDKPVIDEFSLETSNENGLTLNMSGRLDLYTEEQASAEKPNSVHIEVSGPSLDVLQRWTGKLPVEPGQWRASGELSGHQTHYTLSELQLAAGSEDTVTLHAAGSVQRIIPPDKAEAGYRAEGIHLAVDAQTANSAQLAALLKNEAIPPGQAVTASLVLDGSLAELALSEGQVSVTSPGLRITLGPLSGKLQARADIPLGGLAAPLQIALTDTDVLSQFTSWNVPALGPVQLKARLSQKGTLYQLLDVDAWIGRPDSGIGVKGRLGDLAALDDVALGGTVTALGTRRLLTALVPGFSYPDPLGAIDGSFRISRKKSVWGVSALQLAAGTGDPPPPLRFTVDGDIDDLTGVLTANLKSHFDIASPALMHAVSGLSLNATSGDLVLTTTPEKFSGSLAARIGETELNGVGELGLEAGAITGANLTLVVPHLHLQDFAVGETAQPDPAEQPEQVAPTTPLLEKLRQNTPDFPLDLQVSIEGISGEQSYMDSVELKLTGIDGRYTLEQFSARYNQALAEIRGVVDLSIPQPAVSLAGQASAVPMGAILRDLGIQFNITGGLTVLGGVTLIGDNPEAMLANLNGSLALALENAEVEGAAYDLLATDLLAWIYSGALTDDSTHLDCTMAKFQLAQGVASTDDLYVESSRMVATGSAKFDLVKQRLDVRITPRSKSRMLQVPSEVRVHGDMHKPKADISPVSQVADAASSALLLIPNLTLKLFGVGSGKPYRPCQASLGG